MAKGKLGPPEELGKGRKFVEINMRTDEFKCAVV